MKKILLIFIALILSGCTDSKERLNAAWKKSYGIDYGKTYEFNQPLINEICEDFHKVQKANKNDWMCGYIQECQLFTSLHLFGLIGKDEMLFKIQEIYDRFNSLNEKNTFSYAVLQYLMGDFDESEKILRPIFKKDFTYHYTREDFSNADVKNFFAGAMLGEIDLNDLKGTIYDELGYISMFETKLIELLCATL